MFVPNVFLIEAMLSSKEQEGTSSGLNNAFTVDVLNVPVVPTTLRRKDGAVL